MTYGPQHGSGRKGGTATAEPKGKNPKPAAETDTAQRQTKPSKGMTVKERLVYFLLPERGITLDRIFSALLFTVENEADEQSRINAFAYLVRVSPYVEFSNSKRTPEGQYPRGVNAPDEKKLQDIHARLNLFEAQIGVDCPTLNIATTHAWRFVQHYAGHPIARVYAFSRALKKLVEFSKKITCTPTDSKLNPAELNATIWRNWETIEAAKIAMRSAESMPGKFATMRKASEQIADERERDIVMAHLIAEEINDATEGLERLEAIVKEFKGLLRRRPESSLLGGSSDIPESILELLGMNAEGRVSKLPGRMFVSRLG